MPEEKNSTVSNETVDHVENKTLNVVSKEVLSLKKMEQKELDKSNHPDPFNKGSIAEMEEGKWRRKKM